MEYHLYLDWFLLVNFFVNLILLLCLQLVFTERTSFFRWGGAAAFGSAGAAAVLLLSGPLPLSGLMEAFFMVRIQYGKKNMGFLIKRGCVLYFMAFCLEGAIAYSDFIKGTGCLLLAAFLLGKEKKRRDRYFDVLLTFHGKTVALEGFFDTGNLLVEPMTGKPVHIVSYRAVKEILPPCYREAAEYYFQTGTLESTKVSEFEMYEFTFLSYHSIGKENGQLLGIRMDTAVFRNGAGKRTQKKTVIGLADQNVFLTGRCQMIMNGRTEL